MAKTIAVLGTLDTKGAEVRWLGELIEARGHRALVIDVGIAHQPTVAADVPREEVAAAAGETIPNLIVAGSRDRSIESMGTGAGRVVRSLYEAGRLDGAIGVGGAQGTWLVSRAMQELPFGVPKLVVSTIASGNIRPWARHKDIAVLFSVADILGGPNTVSKAVLANAAGAIAGMVEAGGGAVARGKRTAVGLTAFGTTNTAVITAVGLLQEMGCEPIAFHASGACGTAMEDLIDQGVIDAVLDFTTHELVGELFPQDIYAAVKPGRLAAAGRRGIPQVIAPGGLNHTVFGPADTIPAAFRQRQVYAHNPAITAVKLTPDELRQVARLVAERLNAAQGPVAVLIPLLGWSDVDKEGAALPNPEGNRAFVAELKLRLAARITLRELPLHMNDPAFAREAVAQLAAQMPASA